jgi:hypothetical protein
MGLALASLVVDLGAVSPEWSALAIGAACALGARVVVPRFRLPEAPVPV